MSIPLHRLLGRLLPIPLAAALLLSIPAVSGAASAGVSGPENAVSAAVQGASRETVADYARFLKDKFGIAFSGAPTKGEFLAATAAAFRLVREDAEASVADGDSIFTDVKASSSYYEAAIALYREGVISSGALNPGAPLTAINAAQIAVKASGLKELAYTYPADKANRTLEPFRLSTALLGLRGAQELAAAIDAGLVPADHYHLIRERSAATAKYAAVLLGKTLETRGEYKRYIGWVSDDHILNELLNAYRASGIVKAPALQAIGDRALEEQLVTGYTIRDSRYESNFVDELTITYAHADIRHALQLVALLRSEGIDARVQYEPRTSAFVYLKEWGDPGESEYHEVRQIANGNWIEYAKEYELVFEFRSTADRDRFDGIIRQYAKMNEADQPGLIYGSWWQPLYYANVRPAGDYRLIANNRLSDGRYYLESFSLIGQTDDIAAAYRTDEPGITYASYTFWANAAFYRI
ncbi:MAG: hypothetical protein A9Z00_02175 [Thermobacillus sp. ZCTH02-B1]|uniref:S-layer homology domain-containing protein n=1 Tax=Thermobacillus sp. ZCTH02-B1 TaxID=1858795 RepID=UPI000B576FE3|nr:S-layer homology domain-containing protein [Thermobacillus sp. ZCTH02-B1]OUM94390.1 MAG: hypothetical protein A9Z00_02175 [Thermobacillus sp. ZCTH02-B1]